MGTCRPMLLKHMVCVDAARFLGEHRASETVRSVISIWELCCVVFDFNGTGLASNFNQLGSEKTATHL